MEAKHIYCILVTDVFTVPLTFDLAGQRIHCLGSVCRGRFQGFGLVCRKELKEKLRGTHGERECIVSMRCHKC